MVDNAKTYERNCVLQSYYIRRVHYPTTESTDLTQRYYLFLDNEAENRLQSVRKGISGFVTPL